MKLTKEIRQQSFNCDAICYDYDSLCPAFKRRLVHYGGFKPIFEEGGQRRESGGRDLFDVELTPKMSIQEGVGGDGMASTSSLRANFLGPETPNLAINVEVYTALLSGEVRERGL